LQATAFETPRSTPYSNLRSALRSKTPSFEVPLSGLACWWPLSLSPRGTRSALYHWFPADNPEWCWNPARVFNRASAGCAADPIAREPAARRKCAAG